MTAAPLDLERATELSHAFLDAWTSQDVARVLDCYTEDLAYTDPNTPRPIVGRAAFAKYLEKLFFAWTMTWTLREVHPHTSGAGAQVLWTGTFRRRAGGDTVAIDGMDLVAMRGDRILRNDVVFDRTRLPRGERAPLDPAVHALVIKSWLTHDAMWLRAAIEELGVEGANRLNLRAVRDAAAVEARRVLALMGMDRVTDAAELDAFLRRARELLVGDALEATWTVHPPDALSIEVSSCFAERGLSRLGVLDVYQCGIYERMWGWLDALGVRHAYDPDTRACTKGDAPHCTRIVRLTFPQPNAAAAPLGR